jgi:autotransporter-associated beta strand protein
MRIAKHATSVPTIRTACTGRGLRSIARQSLAVLLATTALGVVAAHATDGTWTGATGEWVDGTNWTSNPLVPDGTATFSNTGATAVVNDNGSVVIGAVLFTAAPNAQAYTITIDNPFIVNGTGITNNSTNTQNFEVTSGNVLVFQNGSTASGGTGAVRITNDSGGTLDFEDTSSAGNSHSTIINNGIMSFNVSSTAGSATITNNVELDFFQATSAGSAIITNAAAATLTFNNTATASTSTITTTGTVQFNNSSTAASATINMSGSATTTFNNSSSAGSSTISLANLSTSLLTFNDTSSAGTAGIFVGSGATLDFNNASTAANSNITTLIGATINFSNSSAAGNATILSSSSTVDFHDTSTAGAANITASGSGGVSFHDTSTAGTSTLTSSNVGLVSFLDSSSAGNATINNNNNVGGGLQFSNSSTAANATIAIGASAAALFIDTSTAGNSVITNNGGLFFENSATAGNAVITTTSGAFTTFIDTSTGGAARFITNAGGTFDMSGLTSTGMTAGSIEGAGSYVLGAKNLAVGSNNLSTTVSGVISGIGGSLTKVGTGALTLSNTESYTGATTVNAGLLIVDGSTASSALTTVNPTGTLAGSGTVGNTAIAGGTLAPGSPGGSIFGPLTVNGSLSFTTASTYLIQVSPANAGLTNVTGTATLGGATVNAAFLPGSYVNKQYTIVHATGGVSGTFNPAVTSNMANIQSTLSYDSNNAFLNIALSFVPPPGGALNVNQQNVANALTGFFNSTGSIPAVFASLNAAGLTIASGELGTGVIQSSIKADDLFLNLLLDPTIAGRAGGFAQGGGASSQFAAGDEALAFTAKRTASPSERDAYAMVTKAPLLSAPPVNRWSVWGAAYGGSETVGGSSVVGSQDLTARVWGVAAGADYKVSPSTLLGFALAGGGTGFSLANGLGRGSSDLFQAGAYGRTNIGPAYLSAALAYGWHDVTTNRTVALAGIDQLQGRFRAETFSGRFEGGYRFATPFVGITPYAAAQVISFNLPNYAERSLVGGGLFALNYAAQTTTDTRTELGLRSDKSFAMQDAVLTLRGRAAWAHDYNPDRAVTGIFQALPGAAFVVNGARPNADSALVSAGAEMKWLNGFSLAATFEGEFSGNVMSYAGKGVAKYTW